MTVGDCLDKNLSIIAQRWPGMQQELLPLAPLDELELLVNGDQILGLRFAGRDLVSRYDRLAEAGLRASRIPEQADEAWVYGVGTGELPALLLQRAVLRRLHLVVFNKRLFKELLQIVDCRAWLSDNRVELQWADSLHKVEAPFVAVSPCLQAAEDSAVELRDLVQLELNTPFINARFERRRPKLERAIEENRARIKQDGDVAELFGSAISQTLLVAAAGPSLDELSTVFSGFKQKPAVICLDASLKPLMDQGIVPQYVVTMDAARSNINAYFDFDLSGLVDSTLIYFPVVSPAVIHSWPGRRLCAYGAGSLYQALQTKLPRGILESHGSVVHAAVDLAIKMGAGQIVLCGTDFGMPEGRNYASGVNREVRADEAALGSHWVFDGYGQKITSQPNLIGYLRDLEQQVAAHPEVSFINASHKGARITGVSYLDQAGDPYES